MDWQLGFITTQPRSDWQVKRLTKALAALGTVELVDPSKLRIICGRADERQILMLLANGNDARRFDGVLLGHLAGAKADVDVQFDSGRMFDLLGTPSVNRVGPMLAAQDKLWTAAVLTQAGIPTPLCSSVPCPADALIATAEIGSCVAKPLFGSLGEGQFRCVDQRSRRALARAVRDRPYLVQRFVPPGGTDYRLFVVGDRVEGCIRREALDEKEWRANAALGSRVIAMVPHRAWRDVAIAAARALKLEVAGVDIALDNGTPTVFEVNGVPSFRALYRATRRDMAPLIAARLGHLIRTGRHGRNAGTRRRTRVGA
jgi:ribosomal protein S6--L-glutamate ligase